MWKSLLTSRMGRCRRRTWLALVVLCAGGLLPGTCMLRTKDAIVQGSQTFLASVLLNPTNFNFPLDSDN